MPRLASVKENVANIKAQTKVAVKPKEAATKSVKPTKNVEPKEKEFKSAYLGIYLLYVY